jgi:hypothetical protein
MPASIDPEHVVITEAVEGSDIPVQLMYVETVDGVYAPVGLRTPGGRASAGSRLPAGDGWAAAVRLRAARPAHRSSPAD